MESRVVHQRREVLAFSAKHIRRINAVAKDKTEHWIQTKLVPMVEKGEPFDVGKEMIGITLNAIAETAFEYTLSDDEKSIFLHELELCQRRNSLKEIFANPLRCLLAGLLIPERRRAFVGLKIHHHYQRQAHPTKGTIIDLVANNDAYENDEERSADIILLLIAGHDTTGYTMAWILKELAKNPKDQRRLPDTLRASDSNKWGQSEYLRNVVKEGIRLRPVSARGPFRRIGRDFETKEGYLLPKNSIICAAVLTMMRDEDV